MTVEGDDTPVQHQEDHLLLHCHQLSALVIEYVIHTGCSQKGGMQYVPLNLLFFGLLLMFWAFFTIQYGRFFILVLLGHMIEKKDEKSHPPKK